MNISHRRASYLIELLENRMLLASFRGVSLQDEFDILGGGPTTSPCPDTMGAIGPNHFMEEIKGAVAIFDKNTGARLSITTLANFFTVTIDGTTYPRGGISDPHCLYDARSGHWFAVALEVGVNMQDNGILLAVSRTNDPTGSWDKYLLDVGFTNVFTDYDTFGIDDNGLYLAANMFGDVTTDCQIIATPKAPLIAASPSLGTVFQFPNIPDLFSAQPAFNFDPVAPSGRTWFVSSSTTSNSNVNYRTLTWSGGIPTLSATSVVTSPAYGNPLNAPAMGSTTNLNVVDDRLNMAVIRNGRLWTARNVGVNATGGATGSNRTAVEWLELNVTGASATLVQSGRIYDPAATTPRYYYVPSVNVNAQGAALIGFSGSKGSEFIGAYTSRRIASDPAGFATTPAVMKAGEAAYQRLDGSGRNRWGDYSYTSIDPTDDLTMWTIQEYASTGAAGNIWGTWIASFVPNGVWDGGGDGANWNDPINWSNNVLPTAADDVFIRTSGSPTITLSNTRTQVRSLTLGNGGTSTPILSLATGGNRLLITGSLNVMAGSKLDLNDNDMIVDYTGATPLTSIQSLINSARAGGTWLGNGLTSSSARNNPQHNTSLGPIEATDFKLANPGATMFDGEPIDNTAVLVKYTYYGDGNFNGQVDGSDYARIDATFNNEVSTQSNIGGWFNGDCDGNGKVDGADYALIDAAFNSQTTQLKPRLGFVRRAR